jgi:YD repeat-containing protein
MACPVNWNPVNLPGRFAYDQTFFCTFSQSIAEPAPSCKAAPKKGDPIYPESGVQTEIWTDYRSAGGVLRFDRNYRSDGTSFTSILSHVGFADFSQPTGVKYQSCLSLPYKRPPNYTDDTYCFPLMSTGDPQAVLWTDSGRMLSFNVSGTSYTPDGDINDRVWQTHDAQGNLQWLSRREDNSLELYGPNGARLSKTFANGQSVQYTYSDGTTPASVAPWPGLLIAETDTFGRSLKFQYDAGGRMTTMTDPSGQNTTYGYDSTSAECVTGRCDRLTSVTYPDGYELEYIWNESANTSGLNLPSTLTGVYEDWPATASTPAKRLRFATFKFDGNGVVSTEQANGVYRYSLSNRTANTVTVNDPLGSATVHTYNTYFGRTYTTAISQPAGSGCSASNNGSAYDPNTGNLTQRDDFDGHRTCYAYDASGRNLETTRVEGLSNSANCGGYLSSGAALPTGSRKTSTQWHPVWRLPTQVAEAGRFTTYVYNGQPDPFNGNAAASCAPNTARLPDGNPIAVLCKKVEQATKDTDGSQGFGMPAVPGDANYNSVVLLTHMDGSDSSTTIIDSSSKGHSPSSSNANLSVTSPKYGVSSLQFNGSTSANYGASADWNVSGSWTIEGWFYLAPGSTSGRTPHLWQVGRDLQHRVNMYINQGTLTYYQQNGSAGTASILGPVSEGAWFHVAASSSAGSTKLFLNGNLVATASGAIDNNSGNTLSLGVQTFGPLSGDWLIGNADEIRLTQGVARYGASFTPPAAPYANSTVGTPASSPAMDNTVANRVWTYTYNAYGQVLTAKGPRTDLDDTTTYTYYSDSTSTHTVGDLQSVKNALGQVTNYTSYDANGNVLEVVDANSVATDYTYDARQRLKTVTTSGQKTQYDYWPTGLLKQVTFPDTSTVSYVYDDAHRLTDVTDSLGNTVHYVLDNLGNRTTEQYKDPNGNLKRELDRVIDALGRVQQTTGRE